MTDGDTKRLIKAALHERFPRHKFSVTRGGEYIAWSDDGPTKVEVEEAIIATGLVEVKQYEHYNGERCLKLPNTYSIIVFDRYNAAERAADQQRRERDMAERTRIRKAAAAAARTRNAALNADAPPHNAQSDPETDQKLDDAFEDLRCRAEAETAAVKELRRRPSWAPPLLIEGELFDLCVALGLLNKEDHPVARLWGTFADPRKPGSILRHKIGVDELPGVACRGFELHPGKERQGTNSILFEAQCRGDGTWQFGPRWWLPSEYAGPQWERLVEERMEHEATLATAAERGENYVNFVATCLQKVKQQLELLEESQDLQAKMRRWQYERHVRVFELAKARVLDFVGAPNAQMQLAGRRAGLCYNCGKVLTDTTSTERGIGPDCYAHKVGFIQSWTRQARRLGQEPPIDLIRLYCGMPRDFVVSVIDEMGVEP